MTGVIGIKNALKSEVGSILPMFAVVVVVLVMIMAVAIDFSRYVLAGEKLKTASESAAVAAAMSAKRYVRLEVDPGGSEEICCNKEGECRRCCRDCGSPRIIEGPEKELLEDKGYKRLCCSCGCGPVKLLGRWVRYEDNGAEARAAAQMFFNLNKPEELDFDAGGEAIITSVDVYNSKGSSLYPSTVVHTEGKIKNLLMNFIDKMYPDTNLSELGMSRCSQGGAYYYDLNRKLHRSARSIAGCE